MMAESGVTGWSPIQSVTETTRHPLRARTSFMCDREGHNRALEMERKIIKHSLPFNTLADTNFVYCGFQKLIQIKKQLGPEVTATSDIHP